MTVDNWITKLDKLLAEKARLARGQALAAKTIVAARFCEGQVVAFNEVRVLIKEVSNAPTPD